VLNIVTKDLTIINGFDRRRIHSVPSGKTKELFGIVYVTGNLKSKTWQRGRSDRNLYSIGQGSSFKGKGLFDVHTPCGKE